MASGGVPAEAAWISAVILVYSALCLLTSTVMVIMLWKYKERHSYIALTAIFIALSTLVNIAQQVHYATDWVAIKQAQYENAATTLNNPALSTGGPAQIVNLVFFWIQYYCYNVEALFALFWAMSLFKATWRLQLNWFSTREAQVALYSKVFAVVGPAALIGLVHVPAIARTTVLYLVLTNFILAVSFAVGIILLVLILYKYIRTRREVAGRIAKSPWWVSTAASVSSAGRLPSESTDLASASMGEEGRFRQNSGSIYDRALIIRFTVGFLVLAIYEAVIIIYQILSSATSSKVSALPAPDYTVQGIATDLASSLPGVTVSLFFFLIFGTTKSWTAYRTTFFPCCVNSRPNRPMAKRRSSPTVGRRKRSATDESAQELGSHDRSLSGDLETVEGPSRVFGGREQHTRNLSHPLDDPTRSLPSSLAEMEPEEPTGSNGGTAPKELEDKEDSIELNQALKMNDNNMASRVVDKDDKIDMSQALNMNDGGIASVLSHGDDEIDMSQALNLKDDGKASGVAHEEVEIELTQALTWSGDEVPRERMVKKMSLGM